MSPARIPKPTDLSIFDLERIIVQTHPRPDYVKVGQALREIRDRQLFRDLRYGTFRAYCQARLPISFNYVGRLILAARTMDALAAQNPGEVVS